MQVSIRLFGELRSVFQQKIIQLDILAQPTSLWDVMTTIMERAGTPDTVARYLLADPAARTNRSSVPALNPALLVLINDVDSKLLENLATLINDQDIITLLPSIHGG